MFSSKHRIVAPRIVQADSGRSGWWFAALLVITAAVGWFAFDYGRLSAGLDVVAYDEQINILQTKLQEQQKLIEQLRLEAASHERSAQIDSTAVEQVRREMVSLQQEKADLEKEVELLNGLLSDKSIKSVIQLERFEILALEKKDNYRVRFTLVHLTKVGGSVKGFARIKVAGNLAEDDKTYDLDELAIDGSAKIKLGFKNFQKIDVTLALPADFHPESLLITTESSNKNLQQLEERLTWQLSDA